jgi:choline dehydrogenase-like flavoprotein
MHYDVVIIGTGFGGAMTGLTLADRTQGTGKKILMLERGTWWTTPLSTVQDKDVNTLAFLQRKDQPVQVWSSQNYFRGFLDLFTRCLRRTRNTSLLTRWIPRLRNEDGLFDLTWLGKRGLFGRHGDGVMIARSSGVGGGSLVYSNITIRPPNFVVEGPRWPVSWTPAERDYYYQFARDAISVGIVHALREREADGRSQVNGHANRVAGDIEDFVAGSTLTIKQTEATGSTIITYAVTTEQTSKIENELRKGRRVWLDLDPSSPSPSVIKITPQGPFRINTGLSNILARTARLNPFDPPMTPMGKGDPFNPRGVYQLANPATPRSPDPNVPKDPDNVLWLDRARIFQTAMRDMTKDFGAVDLSINDLAWDGTPLVTNGKPKNYCERQGRCNIGCLPGARHTLNKQYLRAVVGGFKPDAPTDPSKDTGPDFPDLSINALCEVDVIKAQAGGGYEVHYDQQSIENYRDQETGKARRKVERKIVTAEIVIVAAGTVGSSEILLRSKSRGTLPGLSEKTGFGFSPNGDYIAFMEPTTHPVGLIKGPVTTSFGHFETDAAGTAAGGSTDPAVGNPDKFHTVEDQGIPPATASLLGEGLPLIASLSKGNTGPLFILYSIWRFACKLLKQAVKDIINNNTKRGRLFESEDELAARMMCVVAMGRDAADATFRLGTGSGETSLRVSKPGGRKFWEDPIYTQIRATLDRLAKKLGDPATAAFQNPLIGNSAAAFKLQAIATSHPLGGCIMADTASNGTVNEHGQPFDISSSDPLGVYNGLYVADGSIVPSALGVNPSLTISALALRIADRIYKTHFL